MKIIVFLIALALFSLPLKAENRTAGILKQYLSVKDALINDNVQSAKKSAKELVKTLQNLSLKQMHKSAVKTAKTVRKNLLLQAASISKSDNLEVQRLAFETLSAELWKLVKADVSLQQKLYYQYCPMRKAGWISAEMVIRNPYYGAKMLSCGQVREQKN